MASGPKKERCKNCRNKKVKGPMKTVIEWRVPKNTPSKRARPISILVPVDEDQLDSP